MGMERDIREFVINNFLFGESEDSLSNSDSFLEKGLIDSMGILTLVEFVRDEYKICIEEEELIPENWDSVERIARYIEKKITPKAPSESPSQQSIPKVTSREYCY